MSEEKLTLEDVNRKVSKGLREVYRMGIEMGRAQMCNEVMAEIAAKRDVREFLFKTTRAIAESELSRLKIPVDELLK